MPRRKTEILEGELKDTYIVQKSRPLFSLWRSEISLSEFKILDVYLSRIDSHDPEHKTVRFSKAEFEKLLDVEQLKPDVLKERLKHLLSRQVEVVENENRSGVINLFSAAFINRDDFEQWQIELSCTPEAMRYFFNVEELGYLRYKLRSIIHITSRFSYIMFMYIETNRFRKEWTVEVDELKSILGCDNSEFYASFKYFNDKVLKYCYRELTEKTELRYSYTPNKVGRKIKDITFRVETLSDNLLQAAPEAKTANITEFDDNPQKSYSNDYIDFLAEAVNREFDETEMKVLSDLANTKDLTDYDRNNNIQTAKYNYLLAMYNKLNLYGKKHKIKDRFAYLKKIIEQDVAEG